MKNPYEVLGVPKTATKEEIKTAFRKLSKQWHPDKPDGNTEKFQDINDANEILSDDNKRAQYDRTGSTSNHHNHGGFSGGFPFEDLMQDFFKNQGDFFGHSKHKPKGNDHVITVNLSLSDILFGVTKHVKYNRLYPCSPCNGTGGKLEKCTKCNGSGSIKINQVYGTTRIQSHGPCTTCNSTGEIVTDPCKTCHGSGTEHKEHDQEIKFPEGIIDGYQMAIENGGDYIRNGLHGDLNIKVQEIPHPKWKRNKFDIIIDEKIPLVNFIMGSTVDIETPYGTTKYDVKCDNQNVKTFVSDKKGVTPIDNSGRHVYNSKGKMIINISPKMPDTLSDHDISLLNQLKESDNFN